MNADHPDSCLKENGTEIPRSNNQVAITYEDAVSVVYTTQTNQSFTLQQLFSVAG
jgi:hypothetical protein